MTGLLFLLISILAISLIGGGIYLLYRLLTNFQPSKSKVQADLKMLKEELDNWSSELIPWKTEELELLSLNQSNRTVKKNLTTIVKGMFTSIYHEPMVAYAYKRYVSSGKPNAILYARTAEQEFIYRFRNNEITLAIDGQPVGTIKQGGVLYEGRSGKMIGRINRSEKNELLPIIVGERELASLPMPNEEQLPHSRAFQYVEERMNEKEKLVLISLAVLELVQRDLPA
ncbi:MAG: hypothetical protein AAF990_05545 [Bacteroidota bacterium]